MTLSFWSQVYDGLYSGAVIRTSRVLALSELIDR
jgi:hypothetical protein